MHSRSEHKRYGSEGEKRREYGEGSETKERRDIGILYCHNGPWPIDMKMKWERSKEAASGKSREVRERREFEDWDERKKI